LRSPSTLRFLAAEIGQCVLRNLVLLDELLAKTGQRTNSQEEHH
jgi:hypothetical protein